MNVTITTTAEKLKQLQECLRVTEQDFALVSKTVNLPDYVKRILWARILLDFDNSKYECVSDGPMGFHVPPGPEWECDR